MYPSLAAKLSEADVFVVAANDAGLRWSQAPRIHARLGILRAIEQGRPLIHSAQAGYTFLVDAYGRRTPELGLFERGLMVGAVDLTPAPAPYRALGHAWVALAGLVYAGALASLRLSQRIKSKSSP
jgi:apolipoprotein N-acyltransferase